MSEHPPVPPVDEIEGWISVEGEWSDFDPMKTQEVAELIHRMMVLRTQRSADAHE